ncbi:MAG: DNA-formamidopyrimidine glycosylase family protein [Candidatus Bathyarchaeota archaeon]|jgi:formamidopyrimidine-DNA glycosylase|nr:Fpg/Nei family DNA glycosylase [Candidatus Bathyarchaeota archaeon A05DMB-5]MDH7557224.1 DNA-formamidopyrimidine glycosylase family protein [Candidatus Bathyarchaeota archaeon]
MPELPEITVIAGQMNKEIAGKDIVSVEIRQPKNLNIPVAEFEKIIKGKTVTEVFSRGKWIFIKLTSAYYLLVNLGMGAELLCFAPNQALPEKYHFKMMFSDESGFTIHFWWFGYIHLIHEKELCKHELTAKLGTSPTDKSFTVEKFKELLANKKGRIKEFLLDQKNIAGIGNVYAQEILFKARLHPNRKIPTLSEKEIENLYKAIISTLNHSIKLGGLAYEKDFYGKNGKFTIDEFLVGYKTEKSCPLCKTTIEKIKTGSTSSYICPKCQQIK